MPTLTSTKAIAELIDNNQDSIINIVLFSISLELILESFNEFFFLNRRTRIDKFLWYFFLNKVFLSYIKGRRPQIYQVLQIKIKVLPNKEKRILSQKRMHYRSLTGSEYTSEITNSLTLSMPNQQNGQTHSNNSSAVSWQIIWVCLTILWGWHLKGNPRKYNFLLLYLS